MTVRNRTLSHLARALAVSSVVATSSGCDPLPPPHTAVGPTTGSNPNPPPDTTPTLPPEPPPVVCDPMPAPYCPPDAVGDAALSKLLMFATWSEGRLLMSVGFPYNYDYRLDGDPTATHGKIEPPKDLGAGHMYALTPDAPDQPMRVTIKVTCQGLKATAAFDIVAGAPGTEVKTTYVPGK